MILAVIIFAILFYVALVYINRRDALCRAQYRREIEESVVMDMIAAASNPPLTLAQRREAFENHIDGESRYTSDVCICHLDSPCHYCELRGEC